MIFLHGQSFNSKKWEELGTLALLSENGYRAIAIDLPGENKLQTYPCWSFMCSCSSSGRNNIKMCVSNFITGTLVDSEQRYKKKHHLLCSLNYSHITGAGVKVWRVWVLGER